MIPLTLTSIARITNGTLVGADSTIEQVTTDSRVQQENGLFIALIGDKFDAHDFIDQAVANGAKGLIVSQQQETEVAQVVVADTQKALAQIASYVREQVNPKVIAITGSAGKTSVKEMVASILRSFTQSEHQVLATKGNFNNHIGVPLTLLNLNEDHKFAVIEMGANHKGEIAYCASIAKPDVSVINNIEAAHIEGFGSIEGVAQAKQEIYQALSNNGIAVINLDSQFSDRWLEKYSELQKVTVSRHKDARFSAHNCTITTQGKVQFMLRHSDKGCEQSLTVTLQTPGTHNISNALVAAALAHCVGADMESIQSGLQETTSVKGRLDCKQGKSGTLIIDDTYNASVGSVKAAIDYLATLDGHKCLVLGDMAELGEASEDYHTEVGEYAAKKSIDELLACGNKVNHSVIAFGLGGKLLSSKEKLIEELLAEINSKKNILVKGSRSAQMEQVVEALIIKEPNKKLRGGTVC